jgi:hypothetical protein
MGGFIFQILCKVTEFTDCYVVNKLWQSGTLLQSRQARKNTNEKEVYQSQLKLEVKLTRFPIIGVPIIGVLAKRNRTIM